MELPWWISDKESACQCRRCRFSRWLRKILWRRKRQPTPIFLPGKSHGQRSPVGNVSSGHKRVGYDLVTRQQQFLVIISFSLFLCALLLNITFSLSFCLQFLAFYNTWHYFLMIVLAPLSSLLDLLQNLLFITIHSSVRYSKSCHWCLLLLFHWHFFSIS